jgi:RimJ/RimL family protein N-acetyltransferase
MTPTWEEHWPLFGLRVRTPRLELRVIDEPTAFELVDLASTGIHPPELMPFTFPWTDEPDGVRQQNSLRHYWRVRADFAAEKWVLAFAVRRDGELVGSQGLHADNFPLTRVASSGSWIAQRYQGQGIGKEMRAAILHLAFEGLGAVRCESAAFENNPSSRGVSLSLGYVENGDEIKLQRGQPARMVRYKLERSAWERQRRDDIVIDGLDRALPMFGITSARHEGRAGGST